METTQMEIPDSTRVDASDESLELIRELFGRFDAHDPYGVADCFESDADLSWQSGASVTGREAVAASLDAVFDAFRSIDHEITAVYETTGSSEDEATSQSEAGTTVVEAEVACESRDGDVAETAASAVIDRDGQSVTSCRLYYGNVVPDSAHEATGGDEPSPDRILTTAFDFFRSKALLVTVDLGIFTELARSDRPLTGEEVAERLDLDPRASADLLDALVAMDFLVREDGRYQNAPAPAAFLDERKPHYVGDLLAMANNRLYPLWGSLAEAVRTGQPQNELADAPDEESVFDLMYEDDEEQAQFLQAMSALSMPFARVIADRFPWKRHETVCDLGTSEGMFLYQVVSRNDGVEGIGVDLPEVRPHFEEFVAERGVADRLRFRGLDFFEEPLPDADAYVLGHVLSDWSLDRKQLLVEKAYESLSAGGALVVYGPMIDDERRENGFGLLMSLNMLLDSSGGFKYTTEECENWLQEAGFDEVEVAPLPGMETMMVGRKHS